MTVKAADCAVAGQEYTWNESTWYVASSKADVQAKIAANTYPANRIVTTRLTDMSSMFSSNDTFNQDIANWDVSRVISMNYMFYYVKTFNQDLSNWDVSRVATMQ